MTPSQLRREKEILAELAALETRKGELEKELLRLDEEITRSAGREKRAEARFEEGRDEQGT